MNSLLDLQLTITNPFCWAVVVAQLAERSLPEVRGSNPDIEFLYGAFIYSQLYLFKKKEAGNGPFKKVYNV